MSKFIGSAVDVRITGESGTYATARSTATYHTAAGNLRVGQTVGTNYYVYRSFLYFDTSTIPGGDTVTAATLGVKVAADYTVYQDFNLKAYVYDWKAVDAGTRDDVFDLGTAGSLSSTAATLCAAASATSTHGAGAWHTFALAGAELNGVIKGGISRFALRSDRDIAGTTPTANEYQEFYEGSAAGANSPYLEVTHRTETGSRIVRLYSTGIYTTNFSPLG